MSDPRLPSDLAARFASIALENVVREYPNKLDHVMNGDADVAPPRALHPSFYGSFDWHSSVHMHWSLARLLRLAGPLPQADAIVALFDRHLARDAVAAEVAYLGRAGTRSFERTYGWAWLLKLAQEIALGEHAAFRRWQANLAPLADAFVARYLDYLPKAAHPMRTGMHANSAFGLALALDYARTAKESALESLCVQKALGWFADDRDYPAAWEPSGADFLSPALMEAELMRRVVSPAAFGDWLTDFLPGLASEAPRTLFVPVVPLDRGDPQLVHLDGLNLSRAWCFDGIAHALGEHDARADVARRAAEAHRVAGIAALDNADYMGAHWLASFALLALSGA